jgi:hypothetical protein
MSLEDARAEREKTRIFGEGRRSETQKTVRHLIIIVWQILGALIVCAVLIALILRIAQMFVPWQFLKEDQMRDIDLVVSAAVGGVIVESVRIVFFTRHSEEPQDD